MINPTNSLILNPPKIQENQIKSPYSLFNPSLFKPLTMTKKKLKLRSGAQRVKNSDDGEAGKTCKSATQRKTKQVDSSLFLRQEKEHFNKKSLFGLPWIEVKNTHLPSCCWEVLDSMQLATGRSLSGWN